MCLVAWRPKRSLTIWSMAFNRVTVSASGFDFPRFPNFPLGSALGIGATQYANSSCTEFEDSEWGPKFLKREAPQLRMASYTPTTELCILCIICITLAL